MLIIPDRHPPRCPTPDEVGALRAMWHAFWRHGYHRFVDVLFDVNARTDPGRFVAALLAAGAALTVLALAVLGAAARAVAGLFT